MRRLIHQCQRSIAPRVNGRAAFPAIGLELLHRQSLRPCGFDVAAEETESKFAHRQPIHGLAIVAAQRYIPLTEETGQEGRPEVGKMIEETRSDPLSSRLPGIQCDQL